MTVNSYKKSTIALASESPLFIRELSTLSPSTALSTPSRFENEPEPASPALPVPQLVLEKIAAHARKGYPDEVCGAWSQSLCGSFQVHPFTNQLRGNTARNRFFADPIEVLSLLEAERRGELSLLGFYHSHPNTSPQLSQEDIRQMMHRGLPLYPEQDILIAGIHAQGQITWALYQWFQSPPLHTEKSHDRIQAYQGASKTP